MAEEFREDANGGGVSLDEFRVEEFWVLREDGGEGVEGGVEVGFGVDESGMGGRMEEKGLARRDEGIQRKEVNGSRMARSSVNKEETRLSSDSLLRLVWELDSHLLVLLHSPLELDELTTKRRKRDLLFSLAIFSSLIEPGSQRRNRRRLG